MKVNRFFGFFFNLIPGALHMYAGYMKQGFQLLGLFGLSVVSMALLASNQAELVAIVFILPAIMLYMYSFFDGLRILRNRLRAVEGEKELDVLPVTFIKKTVYGPYWSLIVKGIGALLLLSGFVSLVRAILNTIFNNDFFRQFFYSFSYNLGNVVTSLIILFIGYIVFRYAKNVHTVHVPDEEPSYFAEEEPTKTSEYDDYGN